MMIERAIVQEMVIASDGTETVREYARPIEVRALAQRVRSWTAAPEACVTCHAANAICLRGGVALCGLCRDTRSHRLAAIEGGGRRLVHRDPSTVESGSGNALVGHAIVVNQRSVDLGGFTEIIRPEALDRTMAEARDLRALWNHEPSDILGRTPQTLSYRVDPQGLAVTIEMPRWAARYVETVDRGDVSGMSFAFSALDDDWYLENETVIREVIDMRVREVSPVSFPAYPQTDVHVAAARGQHSRAWWERWHRTQLAR
jgi:HK97 family phage prohead protease